VGIVKVIAEAHPDSTDSAWQAIDVAAVRPLHTGRSRSDQSRQAPGRDSTGPAAASVGATGDGGRVANHLPDGRPSLTSPPTFPGA